MLVRLAEQLEDERKTRLLAVFNEVNQNFTRAYKLLQPGGEGELQLENTKNPFEGGLRMACIPPGKSKRTRRSFLSGGEKSMAALASFSLSKITSLAHSTTLTRLTRTLIHSTLSESLLSVEFVVPTLNSSW